MSQSAHPSRLSKTNRADGETGPYGASRRESLSRPLTERDGVTLREELRDLDRLDGRRAVDWRTAVHRWREYILDRRDDGVPVFEDESGERVRGTARPHRFHPDYADRQYAKLCDLESGVRERWGRTAHAALLSFTASSTDDDGRPLPPVDHLDELLSSWDAVKRALGRVLDGREWCRARLLEPHESGYLHVHVAVFVKGPVDPDDFRPVVDAHLRNCDLAERDAHRVDGRAVSIHRVGSDRESGEIENLAAYLSEYLGGYGGDPLDLADHRQMANAVLWATGRRRFQPDADARQFTAYEPPDDGEEMDWQMVAYAVDGEERPVDPEHSGGVERFTTGPPPDTTPPPSPG